MQQTCWDNVGKVLKKKKKKEVSQSLLCGRQFTSDLQFHDICFHPTLNN